MSAHPLFSISEEGEWKKDLTLEEELLIGRSPDCVVRLDNHAVSRRHARIRRTSDGVLIERLSDFAPIYVNGKDCSYAQIKEGDVVSIGPFELEYQRPKWNKEPQNVGHAFTGTLAPTEPIQKSILTLVPTVAVSDSQELPASPAILPAVEEPLSPAVEMNMAGSPEISADLLNPENQDAPAELSLEDPFPMQSEPISDGQPSSFQENGPTLDAPAMDSPMVSDLVENSSQDTPVMDLAQNGDGTLMISMDAFAKLLFKSGDSNFVEYILEKAETSLGRSRQCDIILNDKKASRRQAVILKSKNRFILKDLGTGNGTFVNGEAIREHALNAGDIIRIGDTEFQFSADDPGFAQQGVDALPPLEPTPAPMANMDSPEAVNLNPAVNVGADAVQGIAGIDPSPSEAKGLAGQIEKFKRLPLIQKFLILCVAGLAYLYLFEEPLFNQYILGIRPQRKVSKPVEKKKTEEQSAASKWDQLTPEQKKYIEAQYQLAFDFYTQKEYDKSIFEIQKIYTIFPEYERAKELERYALEAKRRIEAQQEEKRKKEEEELRNKRIAELITKTERHMAKKEYDQAKELFIEILAFDPEHPRVQAWQKEIDEFFQEQKRLEEEKIAQEQLRKQAEDLYQNAYGLQKQGFFRKAIKAYQKILEVGFTDEVFIGKIKTMIQACQDAIRDQRDPTLQDARDRENQADWISAYNLYLKASQIDPDHPEAFRGMDRIKEIINQKAKVVYTKGVIAESYSDFDMAQKSYEEILKTAPVGSLYYERAQRKLKNYLHFQRAPATDSAAEE